MKQFFLLITLILFIGCGQRFQSKELEKVDLLLNKYRLDSAKQILRSQNVNELKEADRYYFCLLQAELRYKEDKEIDLDTMRRTLTFFMNANDTRKQIRVTMCMAYALWNSEQKDSAVYYAKNAEYKAKKANDVSLLMKTYNFLIYANAETKNNHTALTYCQKLLKTAQKAKDKHEIGYAYDIMAIEFAKIGLRDSFLYYMEKTIPYIEYQPKSEQPYLYNDVAALYYYKGDAKKQEFYLRKGMQISPLPLLYGNLANLYINEGRLSDAEQLWQKALNTSNGPEKISFMKFYAKWLKESGRMDEYGEVNSKIIQLKDSLDKKSQTERVKTVQDDFEKKAEESEWKFIIWITIAVAVVGFAFLIGYYLLHRHNLRKEIHRLGSQAKVNDELLKQNLAQFETLRKKQGASQRKIKRLETKIETLSTHQDELLAKGKQRFVEIMNGGRTITWKKDDFVCFVEYYGVEHSEFVMKLNQHYDGLSPSQKCFLVLFNMGKTDEEVADIMNLSPSALRMTRSRINKKYCF